MQQSKWYPYRGLFIMIGMLAIWGSLLAIGSFWGPRNEIESLRFDWRRGLIMLGCMATFLMFWGLLIWAKRRSLNRRDENESSSS